MIPTFLGGLLKKELASLWNGTPSTNSYTSFREDETNEVTEVELSGTIQEDQESILLEDN